MIPISNVKRQNIEMAPEIMSAIQEVLYSGQYIKGHYLSQFEMQFSEYTGTDYCIGVNSGTDALFIAMKAAGIGPGDEVITSAMTFTATGQAIARTGAKPVFVDIKDDGRDLIDPALFQKAITDKTKAVIPVHMHGFMCDMEQIMKIAESHKILVIEDCAQATGAYQTKKHPIIGHQKSGMAGGIGHIGCFSFFPTKNLGAIGDGGAIVTNDRNIASMAFDYREHGGPKNNPHVVGYNSRLDPLQAAILSAKLPMLDEWNARRSKIAADYLETIQLLVDQTSGAFSHLFEIPDVRPIGSVHHHFPIRLKDVATRQALTSYMSEKDIEIIQYYPTILPLQEPFDGDYDLWIKSNAYKQSLLNISLPICHSMTSAEVKHVAYWFCKSLSFIANAIKP